MVCVIRDLRKNLGETLEGWKIYQKKSVIYFYETSIKLETLVSGEKEPDGEFLCAPNLSMGVDYIEFKKHETDRGPEEVWQIQCQLWSQRVYRKELYSAPSTQSSMSIKSSNVTDAASRLELVIPSVSWNTIRTKNTCVEAAMTRSS